MNTDIHTPPPEARQIAVQVLTQIFAQQAQLEDALSDQNGYNTMDRRDRDFARLLITTVLRRRGQIDKVLSSFLRQTPPEPIMTHLRIGAAQMLFLGTPAHAAVGETVTLVKKDQHHAKMSGLVNAVLRNVSRDGGKKLAMTAPVDNLPGWIKRSWTDSYGRSQATRMARQLTDIPPLDISVKADAPMWAEKLGGQVIGPQTVRLESSAHIPGLAGYEDGEWWVQDIAATLPVQILGDVKGKKVADICAAPGGKTLQLAAKGAVVTAVDKSEKRLERLKDNLARTQLATDIICADAFDWLSETNETFDIILIDAPCSATGTFRRHPDVLHNKSPKQVASLAKLQKALIKTARTKLNPGGTLLYCTCSLESAEGEAVAEWFVKNFPEYSAQPLPEDVQSLDSNIVTDNAYLRVLPHALGALGGMDGFFAVSLKCHN